MSQIVRCAIYTRKSSDEGLDQSFNSLDAQREAGEAYIKSQAHEGWRLDARRYDDGGFSGGSMERPALKALLSDIAAGEIDVVVVYKIDRLTRSLADFSRIVEVFEKAGTSFVSVTQSFNTTNSMGRLMLNVLLSFAQFEREVTGERIRDKIAASKAKGMWMGGVPPLGYDLPAPGTRTLQVNEAEAATVRQIFSRYLELGSVHALQRELAEEGLRSKQRVTGTGRTVGGEPFSRGALFHLLRNRIYLGQIVHKGAVHQGEHVAIVEGALFEDVQRKLDANARRHRSSGEHRVSKAPLTGKLFDAAGEPMSPSFSRGKSGRLYRYYVSAPLQRGAAAADVSLRRISAPAIEKLIDDTLERWGVREKHWDQLSAVHVDAGGLFVDLTGTSAATIASRLLNRERLVHASGKNVRVHLDLALPLRGGKRLVTGGASRQDNPDPTLISALRKAHQLIERDQGVPLVTTRPASPYLRKLVRLAFLAPDIQRDILAGRQPPGLNLERLRQLDIPFAWTEQRRLLGWG